MAQLPDVAAQEIRLDVDVAGKTLKGWTELKINVPPEAQNIGLHAYGLHIQAVRVDGAAARFTVRAPDADAPPELPDNVQHPRGHDLVDAACEAAVLHYRRVLERERAPELEIVLPPPSTPAPQKDGDTAAAAPMDVDGAAKPAERRAVVVRIEYAAQSPLCGVQFWGDYAATDNQVRRASAWVPCVDVLLAAVSFSLHLTVRSGEVAVGPGQLLKQTWAGTDQRRKTFHYNVPLACAPHDLGFAVGPFQAAPGRVEPPQLGGLPTTLTAFAPPAAAAGGTARPRGDLAHTAKFAGLPAALFQSGDVLNARLPLPSLQLVFLPPELARGQAQSGVGLVMLSAQWLVDTRSVEQSQRARCELAAALARQWFGHFIRPAIPDDSWLVEGLAGWLEEQYVRRYLGKTELAFRRWQQREVIAAADQGDAPPLAFRSPLPPAMQPWGGLFGTERLDPSPLRSLKATAVVGMLERRAGEDLFRKGVEAVVAGAVKQRDEAGTGDARMLDAAAFLSELGRAGDFKKEVGAFVERWVNGRGVPRITASFKYNRKRPTVLELGMRQSGGVAAKRAADAAERVAQREGIGTGVIKVAVREGSGATVEHPVHAGGLPAVLAEVKVNPEVKKVPGKRGRKRKEEEEVMAEKAAAAINAQHPLQWVRLDPHGEWLCSTRMLQPERMLLNQLKDSRDVVAQAEAVRGLGELRIAPHSQRPLKELAAVLQNTHVFCRVRMEAAMALAALRGDGDEPAGLAALLNYYRGLYFEAEDDDADGAVAPKPVTFPDVSEYLVAQAVVTALAACRAADGSSDFSIIDFFCEATHNYVSAWDPYDDSGLLAALCHGLGEIRVTKIDVDDEAAGGLYDSLFAELERHLNRDIVAPSPDCIVGAACLTAMASLASSGRCRRETLERMLSIMQTCCAERSCALQLREAAHCALLHLLLGLKGLGAALRHGLEVCGPRGDAAVVQVVWRELVALAACTGSARSDLTLEVLRQTLALLGCGHDTRLRHLAFMALCRMQHQPPNIYVAPAYIEVDEDEQDYEEDHYGAAASAGGAAPGMKVMLTLGGAKPAPGAGMAPAVDAGGAQLDAAAVPSEAPAEVAGVVEQPSAQAPVLLDLQRSPARPSPAAAVAVVDAAAPAPAAPKVKLKLKLPPQDASK